ncbi:outer membrane channel protein TolC [Thalassotalea sp. Y01]|uniref:outer membrane channel protein TolC n=1 Tax=Thalassotalea sp. Y01 TaxID=2729613 RepID=UPI00145F2A9F|nr:outer membrane channel protein TolC [Thalassotalea sp. Y01]NMP15963.1 outer membrane channel protein TolC [Thalassotalea sp. Y01]
MIKKLNSVVAGLVLAGFSSLTNAQDLQQIYQLALDNDPTVLRAQAQFNASQETIEQARSVLLPQLNATATYSQTEVERDDQDFLEPETTELALQLNMQLYHHNSWLSLDIAEKNAHRFDINYQFVKQQLITRVTEAYFNVLAAYDGLEFARAEKAAIERQLEQTKQRFSVGLTAITDVHEAQAQFDTAVADEIAAENQVYTAEELLREITGVYPRDLSVLNTERFSPYSPTPSNADEWQKLAEAKNLQLLGQKVNLDIAKESIDLASSGHLPTLSLFGSLSATDTDDDFLDIDGQEDDTQVIGLQLNVPIYSGGNTSSQVREAQQNYVVASQDMELIYRSIIRESRNAYNTINATISGVKALEQSVISAESALKATEAGFEVGTRTIVDVLESTRNLYNAKRQLSTTRYAYIVNMLRLKEAAGTVSEADISAINQGLTAPTQPQTP